MAVVQPLAGIVGGEVDHDAPARGYLHRVLAWACGQRRVSVPSDEAGRAHLGGVPVQVHGVERRCLVDQGEPDALTAADAERGDAGEGVRRVVALGVDAPAVGAHVPR